MSDQRVLACPVFWTGILTFAHHPTLQLQTLLERVTASVFSVSSSASDNLFTARLLIILSPLSPPGLQSPFYHYFPSWSILFGDLINQPPPACLKIFKHLILSIKLFSIWNISTFCFLQWVLNDSDLRDGYSMMPWEEISKFWAVERLREKKTFYLYVLHYKWHFKNTMIHRGRCY